jgi:hypothetical protein
MLEHRNTPINDVGSPARFTVGRILWSASSKDGESSNNSQDETRTKASATEKVL